MTVSNAGPGTRRAARLALEATWGTVNPSPTWYSLVFGDLSLGLERPVLVTSASVGEYGQRWGQRPYKDVTGGFTIPVWPDHVDVLLDLVYNRESNHDLASYTIDVVNPDITGSGESLRYLGCKCNSFSFANGEDQHDLTLTADLIGYDQEENAVFAYPAVPTQVPFSFSMATIELPLSTTVYDVVSFSINVENNLAAGPHTDTGRICALHGSECAVTGTIELLYTKPDHADLVRDGTSSSFKVTYGYPGTGSPVDSLVLYLPKILVADAKESGARNDLIRQTLTFTALIPDAGGRALQITTA